MDSHTTIVLERINNTLSDILKILKAQPNKHPYGTLHCAKCNKPMPQTAVPAASAICEDCSDKRTKNLESKPRKAMTKKKAEILAKYLFT